VSAAGSILDVLQSAVAVRLVEALNVSKYFISVATPAHPRVRATVVLVRARPRYTSLMAAPLPTKLRPRFFPDTDLIDLLSVYFDLLYHNACPGRGMFLFGKK